MRISVIVPTYRRVDSLARCLDGLDRQRRQPDEIVVVVRTTDEETRSYLSARPRPLVKVALVGVPGQVAALNLGFRTVGGDIAAVTDDDTVPCAMWLARIERHFAADPKVGAVGGRDWVYHGGRLEDGRQERVGVVTRYGRLIGNHHIGTGPAREVHYLKGANMSFRTAALAGLQADPLLRGTGAQVHNDLDLSLAVRRNGWRIVYDPEAAVDHYPAPRMDDDRRNGFHPAAAVNTAHNETYVLLKNLDGLARLAALLYALGVGSKSSPGLAQFLRLLPRERRLAMDRLAASCKGRLEGWRTWRTCGRLTPVRAAAAGTENR